MDRAWLREYVVALAGHKHRFADYATKQGVQGGGKVGHRDVCDVYAVVRHFAYVEGNSSREAVSIFGLSSDGLPSEKWSSLNVWLLSRWRKGDEVKRLKELETENSRLRRAVSDLTLDKMILAGETEKQMMQ